MARVLHMLKGNDSTLALVVVAHQQAAGDEVAVALLPGAPVPALPDGVARHRVPDDLAWEALLERIFEADQVITW
jgi:hypothetical protein